MIVSTSIVFFLLLSSCSGYKLNASYSKLIKSQNKGKVKGSSDNFPPDLLPGIARPVNFFDPWLITRNLNLEEVKLLREAELKHGRICMLAAVAYLVQESWNPLFDHKITGASIYHFQQTYNMFPNFLLYLLATISCI